MKRSQRVALVLLGTAGVVGVVTAIDAWRKADTDISQPDTPPVPVSPDRVYSNDDYVAGVGYYHAPYHAWFPHPFNYYDAGRGYFAGGLWQPAPWPIPVTQSMPTTAAVAAALAAQRQQQQQQTNRSRSWFGGSGFHGGGFSSRPAGTPAAPSHSIFRGGFGSSGHHGVS